MEKYQKTVANLAIGVGMVTCAFTAPDMILPLAIVLLFINCGE